MATGSAKTWKKWAIMSSWWPLPHDIKDYPSTYHCSSIFTFLPFHLPHGLLTLGYPACMCQYLACVGSSSAHLVGSYSLWKGHFKEPLLFRTFPDAFRPLESLITTCIFPWALYITSLQDFNYIWLHSLSRLEAPQDQGFILFLFWIPKI